MIAQHGAEGGVLGTVKKLTRAPEGRHRFGSVAPEPTVSRTRKEPLPATAARRRMCPSPRLAPKTGARTWGTGRVVLHLSPQPRLRQAPVLREACGQGETEVSPL